MDETIGSACFFEYLCKMPKFEKISLIIVKKYRKNLPFFEKECIICTI